MALCLMKNYDPYQSPTHFKLMDLLKKFDKNYHVTGKDYGKVGPDRTVDDVMKRRTHGSLELPVHRGHVVPGSVQLRLPADRAVHYSLRHAGRRDFSFCAYNTGVGWRNIIEKMHMTATLTKWYEEHGRHEIFAGGKKVKMDDEDHYAAAARRSGYQRTAARSG